MTVIYQNLFNNFGNKTARLYLGKFRIVLNLRRTCGHRLRSMVGLRSSKFRVNLQLFDGIANSRIAYIETSSRFFVTDNQPIVGLRSLKHHLFVGTDNPWIAFIETPSLFLDTVDRPLVGLRLPKHYLSTLRWH